MNINQIRIWAPLYFWIFQIIVHITRNIYRIFNNSFISIFQTIKITYPLDIITFLVFYFVFAPRIRNRRKLFSNILFITIYFLGYSIVWLVVYSIVNRHAIVLPLEEKSSILLFLSASINAFKYFYYSSMGHTLLYGFWAILIRIVIDLFDENIRQKEKEKEHIKTELALLRSQINPHFLFNTLNNIHSFSQRDSNKTSFAIVKLSEIMRYMLYEANGEKVLLDKEIRYINSYIELQRLRYSNTKFVNINVIGETGGIFIPPMLFIPFIENAFKHGSKIAGDQLLIQIVCTKKKVFFQCNNRMSKKKNITEKNNGGFGIENIKRRLELIYPGNYKLNINNKNQLFSVNLEIYNYED